ncbi:uncharacterized protein PAN0_001d0366 [Moesziomyces antarcticus]|uniref:uncharacterized protein n=1 Tax=Pseudozyma antarctica TaxID=84753 RepID=UPI00071986F6|nr:uncharacterized protein PAN0_001d0366 [Moesziomyces antarcticus]GAK62168.1 hypothetical protein PAN0_001d0366 [Moesziomyces antarcticus]
MGTGIRMQGQARQRNASIRFARLLFGDAPLPGRPHFRPESRAPLGLASPRIAPGWWSGMATNDSPNLSLAISVLLVANPLSLLLSPSPSTSSRSFQQQQQQRRPPRRAFLATNLAGTISQTLLDRMPLELHALVVGLIQPGSSVLILLGPI